MPVAMPPPAQILADSTSLLKHDPGVAQTILHPFSKGSKAARQLRAVHRVVNRFLPDLKKPLTDPVGSLERAVSVICFGQNAKGPSLGAIADHTNPHDPLLHVLVELRMIASSIRGISERRTWPSGYSEWSEEQARALGIDRPTTVTIGVSLGYCVNAQQLLEAADTIAEIEKTLPPVDARRGVVMACATLISRSIYELRPLLLEAGAGQLELRFIDGRPGHYSVDFGTWIEDLSSSVVEALPQVSFEQKFLFHFEQILDEQIAAGLGEADARSASLQRIRQEIPSLYAAATRTAGVAEIHLAAFRMASTKFRQMAQTNEASTRLLASPE